MPSEPPLGSQELLTGQRLCQSKSHQDSVLSALNQQRKDGLLCDVTLVAGEQKFHAHKAVLAACSDYFRAMFSLCMMESEADEVNLQGVTCVGLKHALDFAYTGQIVLEPGVIQDVLSAGSHLQLLELLSLCSHYLIQELSILNYLDLYRLADLFHLPALEEAVVGFLVEHLAELQHSHQEEVLLLPYRLLKEALKSDRLTSLSEEEIWQRVVAGGEVEQSNGRTCAVRSACRYDPRADHWTDIAPMKACREHFVLAALDSFLFAVGGRNELRQVLPSVERYCPKKNKWTFVQPFDRSLSCHAGCVADGLLWFSGGVTNTAQYQNRLMVYDPLQDQWLARSPMLQRRVYHVMAAVRRQLYVLGGNDLDYNNDRILVRNIDCYHIDADQWTRCSFSLLTGQNEAGVAVHEDRIYVVGGYSIWTNEPLACIQVLDVSTEGAEEVFYGPSLPFASNGIATCFLPAPHFSCPNLQTLQVPHHRIGTL
ncbi:LOW QUALITY PROTEIN: kelch-like protein 32 [Alosa sapidissima]|uniref:LOW QUALITY PROTEIN: kelch-like protein 32 n=1 Tax=Alosa sapidissima TaxID=34773 RepID=UPI001C08128B|nr:LOW QUALITY PROTEIN: kelch-like protein 32 [Alosa sapidissima]